MIAWNLLICGRRVDKCADTIGECRAGAIHLTQMWSIVAYVDGQPIFRGHFYFPDGALFKMTHIQK